MASRKIDRAKYGPSTTEVFLGAMLSILLGLIFALAYLVTKPVQIAKSSAKEPVAGQTTFVRGTRDDDRGKQWLRKKQLFTEGNSVAVNEDELNAWISAGTEPERPKPNTPKKLTQAIPPPPVGILSFSTPNFRIRNGTLQIGCEGTLDLEMVALKQPLVMRATGQFVKNGDGFIFVPEQFYLGCCPLHRLPGVANLVFDRLLEDVKIPGNIAAAWRKLADVSVEGSSLLLTMRAAKE
jgi:hypothetical protein